MAGLAERIGCFIGEIEPLFTDEKPISFDPVQMTVLQKLVRPRALGAQLSIRKEEFFKGVLYLDYFAEVIAGRPTVLEDVGVIVEELESLDEYLDPDLELLVRYSGLFITKDLNGDRFFRQASLRQVKKRHERTDQKWVFKDGDAPDLFYLAAGRLVDDMVSTEAGREALNAFESRNDLRAGLLCDAILATLPASEVSEEALAVLATAQFPEAAMVLLQCLVESCRTWSMKRYVDRIHAGLS
ncbi:MAG: hypothetical protein HN348_29180 [Proteobacteria bacterium]|nr:hypothetical protein [Pseudomonadota bacterium]